MTSIVLGAVRLALRAAACATFNYSSQTRLTPTWGRR